MDQFGSGERNEFEWERSRGVFVELVSGKICGFLCLHANPFMLITIVPHPMMRKEYLDFRCEAGNPAFWSLGIWDASLDAPGDANAAWYGVVIL